MSIFLFISASLLGLASVCVVCMIALKDDHYGKTIHKDDLDDED